MSRRKKPTVSQTAPLHLTTSSYPCAVQAARGGTRPHGCTYRIHGVTTQGRALRAYGPELDDMNAVITVARPVVADVNIRQGANGSQPSATTALLDDVVDLRPSNLPLYQRSRLSSACFLAPTETRAQENARIAILDRAFSLVRGGVEPPTFRFSGGFARPGESVTGCLSGLYQVLPHLGVHVQHHASTAVVSTTLARSAAARCASRVGCLCQLGPPGT